MTALTDIFQLISEENARYQLDMPRLEGNYAEENQAATAFLRSILEQAMGRVEQRMGPVLQRDAVYSVAVPAAHEYPLALYAPSLRALASTAIEYWPPGAPLRLEPTARITLPSLGRVERHDTYMWIWPPNDGWPLVATGSQLQVLGYDGLADTDKRVPLIIDALIVNARDLKEGFPTPSMASQTALKRLKPIPSLRSSRRIERD